MKPCIILLLTLPLSVAVTAQSKPLAIAVKSWKPGRLHMQAPQTGAVAVIPLQDSVREQLYRQQGDRRWIQGGVTATYSHATARGKVYTLTPDNMPCLVPDSKAVATMPNAQRLVVRDRSSKLPLQPIIPQDEKQP